MVRYLRSRAKGKAWKIVRVNDILCNTGVPYGWWMVYRRVKYMGYYHYRMSADAWFATIPECMAWIADQYPKRNRFDL